MTIQNIKNRLRLPEYQQEQIMEVADSSFFYIVLTVS